MKTGDFSTLLVQVEVQVEVQVQVRGQVMKQLQLYVQMQMQVLVQVQVTCSLMAARSFLASAGLSIRVASSSILRTGKGSWWVSMVV